MISVPSGQEISLIEVLSDDAEPATLYRFRFLAPMIAEDIESVTALTADMEHLCQEFALPALAEIRREATQIVISLSAQETEFGVPTPEVRQVFEAFSVQNSTCIWEAF